MSLYTDASLIMFPSGYKEEKIYSLKPTDGSGDLTFTRASTATRVNAEGLIEGVRTNLLTYSEQFDNAAWIKSNTTVTANIATSPDGTLNADKLVEDTSNSTHRIAQSAITFTGVAYTQSVFAKSDGSGRFLRMFRASGTYNFAVFDLTNGVVYAQGGSNIISTKIEAYTNGWYKCSSTFTTAFGNIASYIALQNGGLDSYLGDGTSGIYIYGAQLEASASATEYIPTTTTAVSVGMLANVPRIDYTGGGCGKLLLESQRTNKVSTSNDFNGSWNLSFLTATANQIISPDGTLNASKLEMTGEGSLRNQSEVSFNDGYAYSIFIKKGNSRYVTIRSAFFTQSFNCGFDLDTLTSEANGKIEDYGDDWYRLSITKDISGDVDKSGFFYVYLPNSLGSQTSVSGNYVYAYGGQIEDGKYATSYIPTLASSVTRLADAAEKTGISSLIGQTEGTMFLDIKGYTNGGDSRRISISDGTNNNRVVLEFDEIASRIRTYIVGNGLVDGNLDADGINQTERHKIAFVYDGSSLKLFIDGLLKNTLSTSVVTSGMDRLLFAGAIGGNTMFADLQQLQIYKTALTNTEAIALTTL